MSDGGCWVREEVPVSGGAEIVLDVSIDFILECLFWKTSGDEAFNLDARRRLAPNRTFGSVSSRQLEPALAIQDH